MTIHVDRPRRRARRRDPHPGGARVPRALQRRFGAGATSCSPPAVSAATRSPAPAGSTSCPRPPTSATATGRWRRRPPDLHGPPGRDHRADRPQDDDQRAQLRRQGLAGRPGGRQHPALGQRRRRPGEPAATRSGATIDVHVAGGQAATRCATDQRLATIVMRPRGWHLDERHLLVDGAPVVGALVDFGLLLLPQRAGAARARQRAVLLPAEDGEPPRGAAVERRLHLRPGAARHPARHGPGDRAHRDDPGRVRDGRDPLRAARPRLRAQRRPLGLPVQHHQVLPRRRPRVRAARPRRRSR